MRAPMIAGPRTIELISSAPSSMTTRPSTLRVVVDLAVDAGLDRVEHQPVAVEQRILLAGVDPPALQDLVRDPVAMIDEPLDRVGDLELTARRRLDRRARLRGSRA